MNQRAGGFQRLELCPRVTKSKAHVQGVTSQWSVDSEPQEQGGGRGGAGREIVWSVVQECAEVLFRLPLFAPGESTKPAGRRSCGRGLRKAEKTGKERFDGRAREMERPRTMEF